MIDYHRFCEIKHLHAHQGLTASQIAKALVLDPRTVSYWLAQEHFRPRKPSIRLSKLDPFKKEIVRMLEQHPYSAAQVFQRLRVSMVLTAAIRLSRPMCTRSDPGGRLPFSRWPLPLASVPRWIGVRSAPSPWDKRTAS